MAHANKFCGSRQIRMCVCVLETYVGLQTYTDVCVVSHKFPEDFGDVLRSPRLFEGGAACPISFLRGQEEQLSVCVFVCVCVRVCVRVCV